MVVDIGVVEVAVAVVRAASVVVVAVVNVDDAYCNTEFIARDRYRRHSSICGDVDRSTALFERSVVEISAGTILLVSELGDPPDNYNYGNSTRVEEHKTIKKKIERPSKTGK